GYTGIDIDPSNIAYAKRHYPGYRFDVGDALALPFDDASFDVALVVGVLHHLSIEDCRRALAEIVHVVKPNAKALIMEDTDSTGLVRTTHNLDQGAFNTFESRMDVDDGRVLHYRIFLDIRQRSLLLFRLRASQKITMDEIELQDKSSG